VKRVRYAIWINVAVFAFSVVDLLHPPILLIAAMLVGFIAACGLAFWFLHKAVRARWDKYPKNGDPK